MGKKNESDNSSFFIKDIDVFRSVLQAIFVYGCYDQNFLAQKCNYTVDKNKNAKKFYDTCLANHIGNNYMINPFAKRGRPSYATYMNYRRFTNNKNYLFSVYQWVSIAKVIMFKYFIARQNIRYYEDKKDLNQSIKAILGDHSSFNDYFSICISEKYEHVYEFLKSICEEDDMINTINRLCDALSLYGRKSLCSVPAYSIMSKLKRSYIFEGNDDVFSDSEIWDFANDNYDKILYDDAIYIVYQAIRKNQVVGYTRSYDSDNYKTIIPLKIMKEFNLGRCYLIYGRMDSEKIHVIRFDDMFKIKVYNIVNEKDKEKYFQKVEKMKECFEKEQNIWISSSYTIKNTNLCVTINTDDNDALSFIKKYAPYYKISQENKTVEFILRKADDIKPFIRSLGAKAIISKSENPVLYNEFSKDYAEINEQYVNNQDYLSVEEDIIENSNKKEKNTSEKKISDKYVEDKKMLKLFNPYNSYFNIMLEDILEYFLYNNKKGIVDIEPVIRESFSKYGFNTEVEYYGRMLKRFANDLKGVESSNDGTIAEEIFMSFSEDSFDECSDTSSQIKVHIKDLSLEENENMSCEPVQIFTDYEYEYLYLMLQDREVRAMLTDAEAEKMLHKLEKIETIKNSSLNDIFVTRFANRLANTDVEQFHMNIIPVSYAIHNNKKIHFIYKGKQVTGSPYRLMYSLRERIPRLMIQCDGESWIRKVNIDKMRDVNVTEDGSISDGEFEKLINEKKKYIQIVIHNTKEAREKNVFERALRLFSSYEKYTWNDKKNNDYVIAVVYYDFDVLLKSKEKKSIYYSDTIIADILSLGKYVKVLKEARHELPEEVRYIDLEKKCVVPYDKDIYYKIKGIYKNLDELYNG